MLHALCDEGDHGAQGLLTYAHEPAGDELGGEVQGLDGAVSEAQRGAQGLDGAVSEIYALGEPSLSKLQQPQP